MATTAITPKDLALNVKSDDLLDANGTAADTPADGWVIASAAKGRNILLKFLADGTGDTVVIKAGDRPPSHRAGLGDLSVVLAASDVRYIVVETARFLQNDGTLLVTCTDAGTTCLAFLLPKNA